MTILQYQHRDGILDLGWGHPHPDALPVAAWAEAYDCAVRTYGADALTYGHSAGPGPLVSWLAQRFGAEPFVTAGASHALELIAATLVRPGDVVLVQSPTYHLALRALRDHTRDLVRLPGDFHIDIEATGRLIDSLSRAGRRVALAYVVPVHANPTGATMAPELRASLAALLARHDALLVEDNTYVELTYEGGAPPWDPGFAEAVRIGSFAKTVAPGLRLGWFTGPSFVREAVESRGYVVSGGGLNHHTALAMAEFGRSGAYDRHLAEVRDRYRRQRNALVAGVREYLPAAEFEVPAGGWFLWLRLPGIDTAALLGAAEAQGVAYVAGPQFSVDGSDCLDQLRLSYSMLEPDLFATAVGRLALAVESCEQ